MQYNFEARVTLPDQESASLVSEVAEGLEATTQLILGARIRVNTELPDEKIVALTESVKTLVSEKLGADVEVSLISQEY